MGSHAPCHAPRTFAASLAKSTLAAEGRRRVGVLCKIVHSPDSLSKNNYINFASCCLLSRLDRGPSKNGGWGAGRFKFNIDWMLEQELRTAKHKDGFSSSQSQEEQAETGWRAGEEGESGVDSFTAKCYPGSCAVLWPNRLICWQRLPAKNFIKIPLNSIQQFLGSTRRQRSRDTAWEWDQVICICPCRAESHCDIYKTIHN